ncbi:hypothetical protein D9M71_833290 [compost metagenome]
MVFIEAVFVEDRAGDMAKPVASLPTFVAKATQGHQENGIGARLGCIATTRK